MDLIKLCILTLTLALTVSQSLTAPTESTPAETTEMAAELIDTKGTTDEQMANLEETTPKADGEDDGASGGQTDSGKSGEQTEKTQEKSSNEGKDSEKEKPKEKSEKPEK